MVSAFSGKLVHKKKEETRGVYTVLMFLMILKAVIF